MEPSEPTKRCIADRYCDANGIERAKFEDHVLSRALHLPLRWLWPVLAPFIRHKFDIDRQCIAAIGRLNSRRALHDELVEFSYHPKNREFWRAMGGQRISTHRVREMMRDLPA